MNTLDNTQLNPDNKTTNCRGEIYNYMSSYEHGENCSCGKDSMENFVPTEVSTSTKDCTCKKNRNTCTLFTLRDVIIIDLDEEWH